MSGVKSLLWSGSDPTNCQTCDAPLKVRFYDARLPQVGCWAILCPDCYRKFGCELGTGKGQMYQPVYGNPGQWAKVGG